MKPKVLQAYADVPGLGDVVLSKHAQDRLRGLGVALRTFEDALMNPLEPDVWDSTSILWREKRGLRLVIDMRTNPKTIVTAFRVLAQARINS
jgi:hypothetical protein